MKKLLIAALVLIAAQAHAKSIVKPVQLSASLYPKNVSGSAEVLSPRLVDTKMAQVRIDGNTLNLQILAPAECDYFGRMGGFCPEVLEVVKESSLQLVKFEEGACGDTYVAVTPLNHFRQESETLTLVDMSQSMCPILIEGLGQATYELITPMGRADLTFIVSEIAK